MLLFDYFLFVFQQFIYGQGGTNLDLSRAEIILIKRLISRGNGEILS
jgi:hypothetical protein